MGFRLLIAVVEPSGDPTAEDDVVILALAIINNPVLEREEDRLNQERDPGKHHRQIVMERQDAIGFGDVGSVQKDRVRFQMPQDIKLPLDAVPPAVNNGQVFVGEPCGIGLDEGRQHLAMRIQALAEGILLLLRHGHDLRDSGHLRRQSKLLIRRAEHRKI